MKIDLILDYLKKILPESEIKNKNDHYELPTICHNHSHSHASNKLYLYKNEEDDNPLFHCFTECNQTFNIFQLIQKREALENRKCSFKDAYKILYGKDYKKGDEIKQEYKKVDIPKFENPISIQLPDYSPGILDAFQKPDYKHPWHLEGIDLTVLEKFNILYSKSYEGVILPHLDWCGRLVGIRIRSYDPSKVDNFKYMPLLANGTYYRHPLSLNFYGLFENQKDIKKYKRAYIFEAEKSVLIAESIFSKNLSLAVCGKHLSQWHQNILIHYLKVEELIIGFDKEIDYLTDFNKLKEEFSHLTNYMKVGILVDVNNKFKAKESPLDRTKEDFHSMQIWYL